MITFLLEHPVLFILLSALAVLLFTFIALPPFAWLMGILLRPVRKPLDWWIHYWRDRE